MEVFPTAVMIVPATRAATDSYSLTPWTSPPEAPHGRVGGGSSRRRTASSTPDRRLAGALAFVSYGVVLVRVRVPDATGTLGKEKCLEVQKKKRPLNRGSRRKDTHLALVSWLLPSSPASPLSYPQNWLLSHIVEYQFEFD